VQETRILGKNGSDFAFAGIRQQGVTNLKSFEAVDICWVEEAQVVTRRSWDVLIPTIRKPGSEIWITFNPELEDDETYKRFVTEPPAIRGSARSIGRTTRGFPKVLDDERLLMQKRDPVGYKTTWEGQCRPAVEGAIYADEVAALVQDKRIATSRWTRRSRRTGSGTWAGTIRPAIIGAQRSGSEIAIVDYIDGDHRTLADYAQDIRVQKAEPGNAVAPHDGAAANLQTGKSPQEVLEGLGFDVQIVPNLDVEQGIHAARLMFQRCFFDKEKTQPLVNSLKRYRRQLNQTTQAYGPPLHDDNSHAADAFSYMAVVAER
jgi:phage terminase large subunit